MATVVYEPRYDPWEGVSGFLKNMLASYLWKARQQEEGEQLGTLGKVLKSIPETAGPGDIMATIMSAPVSPEMRMMGAKLFSQLPTPEERRAQEELANLRRVQALAEIRKATRPKLTVLKPGQMVIDENGRILQKAPPGTKKQKRYVLKPGEMLVDEQGNVIQSVPKPQQPQDELKAKKAKLDIWTKAIKATLSKYGSAPAMISILGGLSSGEGVDLSNITGSSAYQTLLTRAKEDPTAQRDLQFVNAQFEKIRSLFPDTMLKPKPEEKPEDNGEKDKKEKAKKKYIFDRRKGLIEAK